MSADPVRLLAAYELMARPDCWPCDAALVADYLREQHGENPGALRQGAVGRWRRLDFDSEVFGVPMGRIDWVAAADFAAAGRAGMLRHLVAEADAGGVEQLSFRVSARDVPLVQASEAVGFRAMTVFTGLARQLASDAASPAGVREAHEGDLDALRAITGEAFAAATRFHLDPGLAAGAGILHQRWIENCVAGRAADWVLVAEDATGVTGYITGETDGRAARCLGAGRGSIGLFAVRLSARGRGIGAALIAAACRRFAEEGVARVEVGTESTNNAALNAYARAGFKTVQSCLTLHRWRPRE